MAYEIPSFYLGVLPANVDMSTEATWQFAPVEIVAASGSVEGTGTGGAALGDVSGAGAKALGIVQNNPSQGEAGEVMILGVSKAKIGVGGATLGQELMVSAVKTLIPATSGNYVLARALESASSGDIATVLLVGPYKI